MSKRLVGSEILFVQLKICHLCFILALSPRQCLLTLIFNFPSVKNKVFMDFHVFVTVRSCVSVFAYDLQLGLKYYSYAPIFFSNFFVYHFFVCLFAVS